MSHLQTFLQGEKMQKFLSLMGLVLAIGLSGCGEKNCPPCHQEETQAAVAPEATAPEAEQAPK